MTLTVIYPVDTTHDVTLSTGDGVPLIRDLNLFISSLFAYLGLKKVENFGTSSSL